MTYRPEQSFDIGRFYIAPGIDPERIWVGCGPTHDRAGEGGDFHIEDLEAVIRKFFEDHF